MVELHNTTYSLLRTSHYWKVILTAVLLVAVLGTAQSAVAIQQQTDREPTTSGAWQTTLPANNSTDSVLVVNDDNDAAYTSIQAAVSDAEDGDTVRVRPGTYREEVTVDANITLVAPNGATLNGSTINADTPNYDYGITIVETAKPVIEGFTITGYGVGVEARSTTADWQLRNLTIRAGFMAVSAGGSATSSDWLIEQVTILFIDEAETGIDARSSTGNWTVQNSTVLNADRAIDATNASGDWRVEGVTIRGRLLGIDAAHTSGDWRVERTSIRDIVYGVVAYRATGSWLISNSSIVNTSPGAVYTLRPPMPEGVGVFAGETTGKWTIRGTVFRANEAGGIVAPDADPRGRAIDNRWRNRTRPAEEDCRGNVTCNVSSTTPTASPSPRNPTTPSTTPSPVDVTPTENSDTATPIATTVETDVTGPLSPTVAILAYLVVGLLLLTRN